MPRKISEQRTRKEMNVPPLFGGIDPSIAKHSGRSPQLESAGWYLRDHAEERAKVKIEIPVDGYDKEPWNRVMDYCHLRPQKGDVLVLPVSMLQGTGELCRRIGSGGSSTLWIGNMKLNGFIIKV